MGLERLLDLDELHVQAPQRGGIFGHHVGAQQISAFASARPAQPEREAARGEFLVGLGHTDIDQASDPTRLLLGGAELEHQLVPAVGLLWQLAQPTPQRLQPPSAHGALLEQPPF